MTLTVNQISKRFGTVEALRPVNVRFVPGEIHAVVGENGAGKSTLVNILGGFLEPTSGTIDVDGAALPFGDPIACKALGIEMIHQHFTLVGAFSAEENLALAATKSLWGPLDPRVFAETALRIGAELGWQIPRGVPASSLPVGVLQRIEILKALAADAKIILFDEPTAVLTPDEVLDLFGVIRKLRDSGKTVVIIAHKLSEVFAIADHVTVLRKGELILSSPITDVTPTSLAEAMVGDMPDAPVDGTRSVGEAVLGITALRVRGSQGNEAVREVDFAIRAGEVLGLGGVDGNGQVELAEAIVGVRPVAGGTIALGSDLRVGYVPQDRQADGLALSMSILDNAWIEGIKRDDLTQGPFLLLRKGREWVRSLISRFQIKTPSMELPVGSLSGGNQQKVVVSRVLDQRPDLLVVVNPTRGLDLKAVEFVHQQIRVARDAGTAVLMISTDLDELAALSDRTMFLSRGELSAALLGSEA